MQNTSIASRAAKKILKNDFILKDWNSEFCKIAKIKDIWKYRGAYYE